MGEDKGWEFSPEDVVRDCDVKLMIDVDDGVNVACLSEVELYAIFE